MRTFLAVVGAISVVLAGCTAEPEPKATTQEPTPTIDVTSDTGQIKGVVTDDSLAPVEGAEVAILRTELSAKTDQSGEFSFGDLAPGTVELVVQRIGYSQYGKRVDVKPGEVTELKIILTPLVIETPYAELLMFVANIRVGEALLDIFTSTYAPQVCEKCRWYFNVTADTVSLVTEIEFKPTITNPTGTQMYFAIYDKDTSLKKNAYWKSRDKYQVDRNWNKNGEQLYQLNACDLDWVCVEQKLNGYITLFHVGLPDENYTALPPE